MRSRFQLLFPVCAAALLLALPPALMAQSQPRPRPSGVQPVDEAPPPPAIIEDSTIEPQITIQTKGQDKIEEYRIKGKLYKMRVVPPNGAAYWLIDPKGDGNFVRLDSPTPNNAVPMWVIHEW
jgi:Protein of unknown function (DUF2782)